MFLLVFLLTTGKQVVLIFQMLQLSLIFVQHSLKVVSAIFIKFLFFTTSEPFKNYEKCVLFHLKSSFCSRDIQFFVFSAFPIFYLSAIALEVESREMLKFMMSSIV